MALDTLSTGAVENATKLGLGTGVSFNSSGAVNDPATATLKQSFAPAATAAGLITPTPAAPVSPLTTKPVGTFGGATSTGIDSNYLVKPGESSDAYQQRIAAYNASGGAAPTSSGGYVSAGGTPGFTIDTSSTTPSSALSFGATASDVAGAHQTYADYVQQLAQASGYSPAYLSAYTQSQNLGAQEAELRGNLATGAVPGDTQGYAEGFTNRALMGADAQKSFADIALQAQALARQGDIAGAQALVEGTKPQSVSPGSSLVSPTDGATTYGGAGAYSDYQAQQTYFNLAQNFPDAQIPSYNPALSAQQNLQLAQTAAAQSPSFQSRNLTFVPDGAGGTRAVNKNQIVTDPATGQVAIVTPQQATDAAAASSAVKTLTTQRAQIASQLNTVDANFPLLSGIVKQYGLNSGIPLQNEIQQKIGGQLGQSAITQLNALATGLKATIAQIVSRGGQVDDKTRGEANALLPTNVSYQVLQDLYSTVKAEGAGVLSGIDTEITNQNATLSSLYATGSSLGAPAASTATTGTTAPQGNPFSAASFFGS